MAVKYFGPKAALDDAVVRVAAYGTPDFSGTPVSRTVVTNTSSVTSAKVAHIANALVYGLPRGKYYIMAWLDSKNYGNAYVRDSFESWGYVCSREKSSDAPYAPAAIVVGDTGTSSETALLYIEDTDVNGNNLPDAWEVATSDDGKLHNGTDKIDATLPGDAAVMKSLANNLAVKLGAGATGDGLGAQVVYTLSSPKVAALALNVDPNSLSVDESGRLTVESKVDSVTVSSISIENGNVVIAVDGSQQDVDQSLYGEIATAPTEVVCKVYGKESLDGEWNELASEKITIGAGAASIELPEDNGTTGFYKVVIEQ